MKIIGQNISFPVTEKVPVTRFYENAGASESLMDAIIVEHTLSVFIDGVHSFTMTCSPENLVPLVLGHLFSEGMMDGLDFISQIEISPDGARADLTLSRGMSLKSGGKAVDVSELEAVTPVSLSEEDKARLFAQAQALYDGADLFFLTGAAHSSSLAVKGEVLYRVSDVSRHNTVDKIIGMALLDGIDFGETVLFTSGRIPSDMLQKAARAGIPLIGSRSAPTTAALRTAKELGISLVGFIRQGRMNIY